MEKMSNMDISATMTCPICDSANVVERSEREEFEYGVGDKKVMLSVYIPVFHCAHCEYEFVGEKAANLRHDAVCAHLGLLTPGDIKMLRIKVAGSQQAFADLTRLGIATIQRWEQGALLQTRSNDLFLRFLQIPENVEVAKLLNAGKSMEEALLGSKPTVFKSRGLKQESISEFARKGQEFSLRAANR